MVGVRPIGKLLDDVAIDLAFVRNKEPDFVAHQGSGEISARRPVVELNPLDVLNRGKEICGVKAKVVVTILNGEIREPSRTLTEHGGVAGADNVDLAQRIGVDADLK